MLLGRETLTISGVGQTEPVVLAPAIVAQALGREGYAKVSPAETLRLFEQSLARNRPYLRQLAIAARVAGPSLRDCGDVRLLTLVRGQIRRGGLVGVRAGRRGQRPGDGEGGARRRLARALAGQLLVLDGRRYQVVADVDLATLPGRDGYEVVAQTAARSVLGQMAAQPGMPAARAELLLRAREQLTGDWRAPLAGPHGLVLLRRARALVTASSTEGPAITPSQWRALAASGWIEIEFVDRQGRPVAVVARLELPDATPVEACSGADGVASRRGFAPGLCRLSLPDLDGARWHLQT